MYISSIFLTHTVTFFYNVIFQTDIDWSVFHKNKNNLILKQNKLIFLFIFRVVLENPKCLSLNMFRYLTLFFVLIFLSAAGWQAYCRENYEILILCVSGIMGCIWLFFHLIHRTNRKLNYFFSALENDDYTIHFTEKKGMSSDRLLHSVLNRTKDILQHARLESQQKERYYEILLQHISSGVIALDEKGFVVQLNEAALKLLGLEVFTHIGQLHRLSPAIEETFRTIRAGENRRITSTTERGSIQLLINASGITINNKNIRLLVLNDIENEMDEKEIDSWVRLIRVLAHEIMNSVAPITSLSDTLLAIYKAPDQTYDTTQLEKNTINGLQVISETGKGLVSFVESYRKFTRIPYPEREYIELQEFFQRMIILCSTEANFASIRMFTEIEPVHLKVFADPNLLGQVLLNLMKNAIYALRDQENAYLKLTAEQSPKGYVKIQVIDNGPGIPADIINEIFVPFFTTKDEGSGIGLSIARQIMRAHNGNLKVVSIPHKETTFILIL